MYETCHVPDHETLVLKLKQQQLIDCFGDLSHSESVVSYSCNSNCTTTFVIFSPRFIRQLTANVSIAFYLQGFNWFAIVPYKFIPCPPFIMAPFTIAHWIIFSIGRKVLRLV